MKRSIALWIALSAFVVGAIGGGVAAWIVTEDFESELTVVVEAFNDELTGVAKGMCGRNMEDRVDNARAWTEVEHYMDSVSEIASTRAIREQAADSRAVIGESANQLRHRLLLCDPLIEDGDFEIDERALREAQGDL